MGTGPELDLDDLQFSFPSPIIIPHQEDIARDAGPPGIA